MPDAAARLPLTSPATATGRAAPAAWHAVSPRGAGTGLSAPAAPRTYTNPLPYTDGPAPTNPDPFVLRFRGVYYCYASGRDGVGVSRSRDLVTWQRLGDGLVVPGLWEYWAPCVIYAGGTFWMYYSARPAGADDPHLEYLRVARATRPEGPFTPVRDLFDTFSIDPHVVRDADGSYVMFYSTNHPTALDDRAAGTSILVDRMVAMDQLEGRPRPVVVPTLEQEIFERNRFGDGRDWYTIEGATFFTHQGQAYLTYSANAYVGLDYYVGYSRAALDRPLAELAWTKYPNDYTYAPLIRRTDTVEGTGHNSLTVAPNLVDSWIVYHGRDTDQPLVLGTEQRVMRTDRVTFDGTQLVTGAPTATAQPAPGVPMVFDAFACGQLDPAWQPVAGTWAAGPQAADEPSAAQAPMAAPARVPAGAAEPWLGALSALPDAVAHLVRPERVAAYLAEVYLRADASDAGARCGFIAAYRGPSDYLQVLLDAHSGSVCAVEVSGGVAREIVRAAVPGLDLTQWLCLRVRRTYGLVEVWVDGAAVAQVPCDAAPAAAGLVSVRTAAQFSAFTLTQHATFAGQRLGQLHHAWRPAAPLVPPGTDAVPEADAVPATDAVPGAALAALEAGTGVGDPRPGAANGAGVSAALRRPAGQDVATTGDAWPQEAPQGTVAGGHAVPLTAAGLGSPLREPVSLSHLQPVAGWEMECDLALPAPYSRATWYPVCSADATSYVRVTLQRLDARPATADPGDAGPCTAAMPAPADTAPVPQAPRAVTPHPALAHQFNVEVACDGHTLGAVTIPCACGGTGADLTQRRDTQPPDQPGTVRHTLGAAVLEGRVCLRLGGTTWEVDNPCPRDGVGHLELLGAVLRSYEQTQLASPEASADHPQERN